MAEQACGRQRVGTLAPAGKVLSAQARFVSKSGFSAEAIEALQVLLKV
jgi:hypothetical protein